MDVFTTAFYIAILLNGFTTLRSSRYWEKFKNYFLGGSSDPVVAQDGEDATLNKSDTDASNPEGNKNDLKAEHTVLLKKYLSVYLLASLSDWFQGPYVYALYSSYGFSKRDNAILFVAGFGSSLIFGSFIGGLADSFGRRKFTVVYCLVYALSCVTKHFKNYWMLMFGRILGGIATSLLFTVFDSWLIRAHSDRGLMSFLPSSFSVAAYGNSIVAILSGLISEKAASAKELKPLFSQSEDTALLYKYGYLPPFDMSMFTLICCAIVATYQWEENFGSDKERGESEDQEEKKWYHSFTSAYKVTMQTKEVLLCGIVSSLFEGSMYIFVFLWTPALQKFQSEGLPFGLIFSTFMVCCMAGSSTSSLLLKSYKCEYIACYVMYAATASFCIMAAASNTHTLLFGFMMLEMCVGIYFPIMGTMKSSIVPENKRAAIYNLFRIPLNFIVVFSLVNNFSPAESFIMCIGLLSVASVLQRNLYALRLIIKVTSAPLEDKEDALSSEVETLV